MTDEELLLQTQQVQKSLEGLSITDHAIFKAALQSIVYVDSVKAQGDARKKEFTAPITAETARLKALFGPILDPLQEADSELRAKIIAYLDQCYSIRDEILAMEKTTETIEAAGQVIPEPLAGLSTDRAFVGEMEDPIAVMEWLYNHQMDEMLKIDEKKLQKYTDEHGIDTKIPGWKVTRKRWIRVTKSKVDMT